jgi:Holliday junction resolvase RusA-like endonuclease
VTAGAITLRIAGRATTKQRPRFDPRTKRTYTPPSNIVSENDVRAVWREAGEPRIEDDCAVALEITVTVMRPAGHFKRDGSLSSEGLRHPVPRSQKPDLDNAVKLVMDALNTRAYRDDVRVAKLSAERQWGDWPETLIVLRAIAPVEWSVESRPAVAA